MSQTTRAVLISPRIEELLTSGESETVEYKAHGPDARSAARLLVAFANSRGGTLLIGVDDDGKPIGLSDEEAGQIHLGLRELSSSLLPMDVASGVVDVGGRSVVYVDVPRAPAHLAPIATAEGEFYVRRGAQVIKANGTDLIGAARKSAEERERVDRKARGNRKQGQRGKRRRTGPWQLFVAMSFAFEKDPALVDYFEAIRRAVRRVRRRISITRVDLVPGDYEISQKVMDLIGEADIVLADFTGSPPNVYFEAGYARGCDKWVIQTARSGTALHFDVKTWRTAFFKNATELEEKVFAELVALVGKKGATTRQRTRRKGKRKSR